MALEDAMKELTAAITAQTALLTKMASAGKPASSGKAPDAGSAVDTAKAAARTAGGKAGGSKPKVPTVEELGAKATDYVKSAADRDEAKANIVKISAKFDAERFTAIPEENRAEALELLAQYVAGEDPLADDGDGDDDSPEI